MSARLRLHSPFSFYGRVSAKVLANRALVRLFVGCSVLHGLGQAAMAAAAGALGQSLVGGGAPASGFGPSWTPTTLALIGLGAVLVKGLGATAAATIQSRIAHRVAGDVREDAAARLLSQGAGTSVTHLAARLNVRIGEIERGIEHGVLAQWRGVAQLVPLVAAWFLTSPLLAALAVVVLGPFAMLVAVGRRSFRKSHRRSMLLVEDLHAGVDELGRNIDVWRTYGAGHRVRKTLAELGERAGRLAARVEGSRAALSSANEVLAAAALLVAVLASRAFRSAFDGTNIVAGAAILFMAYRPLRDLGDAGAASLKGLLALEALDEIARTPLELARNAAPAHRWSPARLVVASAGVERPSRPLLTSFEANPGEIVALVGPTGVGKSTLLRALLGLEPGAVGAIRYGDRDLSSAGVGPAERPFAWVPQDAPVLAGTLQDNLLVGDDASEVRNVLALLGAEKLADDLGSTLLGAGGRPVSGGERKWIALARALASELPVLLLDEPTAGLDQDARARVLGALESLRDRRTVILVTHETEPLRIADRVVTMGATPTQRKISRLAEAGLTEVPTP